MRELPLVSVIIPTYNRIDYLLECLDSVTKQTYKKIEIIVVSDGGTDNSEKFVTSIGDPRIHWYNLDINHGRPAPARNYGLKLAKGEFVCFCDDDDIWVEDKLEKQLSSLSGPCDISFSGFNLMGSKPPLISIIKIVFIKNYFRFSKGKAFNLLAIFNPVCNSSVMVRLSAIDNFLFNEMKELRAVEDYVGWIVLFRHLKVAYSETPLVKYRVHDSNISSSYKNSLRALIDYVQSNRNNFPRAWINCFILLNRIRMLLAFKLY